MNKISISRETANAANIESAFREVKVVKENLFKVNVLQDSGIDSSLAVTEDSVLTFEVPNLSFNHEHANLPKSRTSRHVHSLCGLSSIDIMKSTWKQKKTFESSLDTDLEYSASVCTIYEIHLSTFEFVTIFQRSECQRSQTTPDRLIAYIHKR